VEETAEETSVPETSEEEAIPPTPPTPEQIADAQTEDKSDRPKTPIEEIAPDAELAPPAEPPGAGDPQMRQNPPEQAEIATEGIPIDPDHPPQPS
jgi:hypothetical protein